MVKQNKINFHAFTLVELLMVIAVLIVVALIAIPSFNKSRKKAIANEGIANMKLIAAAENIMKMENNGYVDCDNNSECNTKLKLMLNGANWSYKVDAPGNGGAGTATIEGDSSAITCTYTLESADFRSTTTGYSSESGVDCP